MVLPPEVTMAQLLSGQSQTCNPAVTQSPEERRHIVEEILQTGLDFVNKRLLFVLDAYCHGSSEELIVNRAYVVDR
jgi:hypothetical protein